tara:strand:- start:391 stop:795 length:405 start_codon:yes stop_codon:yes gene_type:complete
MNKFFATNEVYEDRMAICRACVYYSKVLGNCTVCKCFMKIKSRIASQSCPQKYWDKTSEVIKAPDDLPDEIIAEILDVWQHLNTGRAKNLEAKKKMITLYNVIHNTNYSVGTSCGSCLSTCYDGIRTLYNKYND